MTRTFPNAGLIALAAMVAGGAALTPAPVAVRVIVALPLVLFLPGFALTAALFPASPPWAERLPLSIALSVAVCVVGGFALHLTQLGLTRESWIPLLVGVTAGGAAVAWRRGWVRETNIETLLARSSSGLSLHAPMLFAPTLLIVPALALVVFAIGLTRTPPPAGGAHGYTALSLFPAKAGSGAVQIGVTSAELRTTSYRLELHAGGQLALRRRVTLETGQQWARIIDASSVPARRRSFEALLYRLDEPRFPYRRVTLILPGAKMPPATAVWLLPGRTKTNTVRTVVTSAEPRRRSFLLEIRAGGRVLRVVPVTIQPGARLHFVTSVASVPRSRRSFEALLYRYGASESDSPYRRATLTDVN